MSEVGVPKLRKSMYAGAIEQTRRRKERASANASSAAPGGKSNKSKKLTKTVLKAANPVSKATIAYDAAKVGSKMMGDYAASKNRKKDRSARRKQRKSLSSFMTSMSKQPISE